MIETNKQLSEAIRTAIVVMKDQNMSIRKISRVLSVPKSTVGRFLKHFKDNKTIHYKKRTGRPKYLTNKMMRRVVKIVEKDRKMSSNEISREVDRNFNMKISPSTIRRRLVKEGLNSRKIINKPKLTNKQIKARLEWAKLHEKYTIDDWSKVLFSDESKFKLFEGDKQGRIRRRSNENPLIVVNEKVKFPTTILVWGCFSSNGTGYFKIIEKTLKTEQYIEILDQKLLNSASKLAIPQEDLILQQMPCIKKCSMPCIKSLKKVV